MAAGKKRYRITIQRLKTDEEEVARQASGKIDLNDPDNWITQATRWAEIKAAGGREWQQEGQVRGEETHIVVVEFDSTTKLVTSGMRVSWSDGGVTRLLDITRVLGTEHKPGGPRRDLELECKEHS